MAFEQGYPSSSQPFVGATLLAPYTGKAAAGQSAYLPHSSSAPVDNVEAALAAARSLCDAAPGSVPVVYVARPEQVRGLTSTRGNPLRPLPTDLPGADGKLLSLCIVN